MTTDWQRCCVAYQGGGCKTPCLHCHRIAEVVKTERQLFIEVLREVDHTLTVHGHLDKSTPLHNKIDGLLSERRGASAGMKGACRLLLTKELLDHFDPGAGDDEPVKSINIGHLKRWVDLAMDIES